MRTLILRQYHIELTFIKLFLLNVTFCIPINNIEESIHILNINSDNICPRIINREQWNARNATNKHENLAIVPTPYVVIHHGGIMHYCYDQNSCSKIVRSYQNLHIDTNHWIDIGYNFVIGEDGNVYEGRGWNFRGAHAPGYNTQSIGISIIGDFSHFNPNIGALTAMEALIACGVSMGKISKNYAVIGHRQGRDTVCPGEVFFNYVMAMPRWTPTPIPLDEFTKQNATTTNTQLPNDRVTYNKITTLL